MAVLEHRVVEFDAPAILRALATAPQVADALGVRASSAVRIAFQPTRQAVIFTGDDGTPVAELGADGLTTLLVEYCVRIKVPLPRRSQKHVEVTSCSVLLRIVAAHLAEEPLNGTRVVVRRPATVSKVQSGP